MSKIIWNESGSRTMEDGVDRGVFYPASGAGVPWNGLVAVREAPSDSKSDALYFDGIKYFQDHSEGIFSGTIEAITYPEEFEPYDGADGFPLMGQQARKPFSFSYRTMTHNELGETNYTIHLVYNVLVAPSNRSYSRMSDSVSLSSFSWDFTTIPLRIPGARPSAHLMLSTKTSYSWTMSALEDILYGQEGENPRMPSPEELTDLIEESSILRIIDHGDGTWTAIGPDDVITMLDPTTFSITWPSAVYISPDVYEISSL